jgi:response regulator RpfG family c-di-GMP phosphodiesterase
MMAAMQNTGPRKNVLIITDDTPEVKVISSTLEKANFHVMNVPCATAVSRLLKSDEPIDVAIIDMPKLQDDEVLQSLHERYPEVRLLFIADDQPALDYGPAGHARGYIHKPVRRAHLLGTVLKLIETPSTCAA